MDEDPTPAQNPLPVDRSEFAAAELVLVVRAVVPGEHEVELEGAIDVAGDSGLRRGDTVRVSWPYAEGQGPSHRPIAFPVRKQADGSYLALSAALSDRKALQALTGQKDDYGPASPDEVRLLVAQAEAIGSYQWTVNPSSDGTEVEARLYRTFKGTPPKALGLRAPETEGSDLAWTFFDGLDAGADFGVLFLTRAADGSWSPITDRMPWTFGSRGLPDPLD